MRSSPSAGAQGRGKIEIERVVRSVRENGEGRACFSACDKAYEGAVEGLARRIAGNKRRARILMLSGPSASGKTTTSIKLQLALQRHGVGAVSISMDDFFKNRDTIPFLPDGSRAYESLDALDTATMADCLNRLVEEGRAQFPLFDFKNGVRAEKRRTVELAPGDVAVVEGLHALDPLVTELFPAQRLMSLYVSVSSDFVDEHGETVLSARDIRLLRRMVRDYRYRAHTAAATLSQWDTVCLGEDLYVRPYKHLADVSVNTVYACEPCLLRRQALRLLDAGGAEEDGECGPCAGRVLAAGRIECAERVARLAAGLRRFPYLPSSVMPAECLLREFLGGSAYYTRGGNRR